MNRGTSFIRLLIYIFLGFAAIRAHAGLAPEVQPAIRAASFEVVLKKPEKDPLTYEKPLPFELVPFLERNDKYQSIGTAFALGQNRYVSAAHVLVPAINSQFGPPELRAANGTVYAIDRIIKFSMHGDFVVFSLAGDPAPAGLAVNRNPKVDDPVFAVGNALGEGIVIRDGVFTSETPEEQDGQWKWIRFSAAASPGNSGGPLLDLQGRVIGIVLRKSMNENLNYSLPIGMVLDASDSKATFDQRELTTLPFIRGTRTYAFKDEFRLPLKWAEFAHAFQAVDDRHDDESVTQLVAAYAEKQFSRGVGVDAILYSRSEPNTEPRLVLQQADDTWLPTAAEIANTPLPDDGFVNVASELGMWLVRVHRSANAWDNAFYNDSKAFMDVALKGLGIQRQVGGDQIRITSLGAAQSESVFSDHYGRVWQHRLWALPYLDCYIDGLLLPTPEGYAALIRMVPSFQLQQTERRLRLMADQVSVSYSGTPAQWQAFLSRSALLPKALSGVTLDNKPDWRLRSPRFETHLLARLFPMSEQGLISLDMDYVLDGGRMVWDVVGVWWFADPDGKSSIGLWRMARPPKSAKQELRTAFADVADRRAPFGGEPLRETADRYSMSNVLDVPGKHPGKAAADVVYGVTVRLSGHDAYQDLTQVISLVDESTHIIEHGNGEEVERLNAQLPPKAQPVEPVFSVADSAVVAAGSGDAFFGTDIRGRRISQDFRDYIVALDPSSANQGSSKVTQRAAALFGYWRIAKGVVNNRDVWGSFLERNQLPGNRPHAVPVVEAQARLAQALSSGEPGPEWQKLAQNLIDAYVGEREAIMRSHGDATPASYVARKTPCPQAAPKLSATEKPAIGPMTRSPNEFYPNSSRRAELEGAVIVAVQVDPAGCGRKMGVVASSGSEELDQAGIEFMDTVEFLPAQRQGQAVEGVYKTVVKFKFSE